MKIRIKSEPYIKCPAPKLTRNLFDWFWNDFWSLNLSHFVDSLETIDIRLNQALPYTPIHFYITVNGVHKFHKEVADYEIERYADEKATGIKREKQHCERRGRKFNINDFMSYRKNLLYVMNNITEKAK